MESSDPRLLIERSDDTVTVSGEIDAATCDALSTALQADGSSTIGRLDLSGVTFMDSSGLRVLIAHRESVAGMNRQLVLRDPSQSVLRLIEVTGLADVFEIVSS